MMKLYYLITGLLISLSMACGNKDGKHAAPVNMDSIVILVTKQSTIPDSMGYCMGRKSEVMLNIPLVRTGNDSMDKKLNKYLAESAFQSDWYKVADQDLASKSSLQKSLEVAANTLIDAYTGGIISYNYGLEKMLVNTYGIISMQMIILTDPCGEYLPLMKRKIITLHVPSASVVDFNEILSETHAEVFTNALNQKKYTIVHSNNPASIDSLVLYMTLGDYAETEKWVDAKGLHLYFNSFAKDPETSAEILFPAALAKEWIKDPRFKAFWK